MQIGKTTHLQPHMPILSACTPLPFFYLLSLFCSFNFNIHISRLRKQQHSTFLSFPWPLVPEPFEKGSIPNINVCCFLITAPLVGDEAEKQTVKLPLLFALLPLSYLALLFHSSSFSATSLTPSVCVCVAQLRAAVLCAARKKCLCVLMSFEKQPIPYISNKLPLMSCSRFIFIFSVSCQVLMFFCRDAAFAV